MAKSIKLDSLLQAIHSAVLEAQLLTEQQHLEQLNRYFEWPEQTGTEGEDLASHIHMFGGKAKTWSIDVPNMHPSAEKNATTTIQVPIMSLMPPTAIKIKNMVVEFKVALGEISQVHDSKAPSLDKNAKGKESTSIGIDLGGISGGGFFGKKTPLAKIKIEFESGEPSESFLRINDHLIKSIV